MIDGDRAWPRHPQRDPVEYFTHHPPGLARPPPATDCGDSPDRRWRRTVLHKAVFASRVVAAMPTLFRRTSPAAAELLPHPREDPRRVSTLNSQRVRQILEWSGGAGGRGRRRNDRTLSDRPSATRSPAPSPALRMPGALRQVRRCHPHRLLWDPSSWVVPIAMPAPFGS